MLRLGDGLASMSKSIGRAQNGPLPAPGHKSPRRRVTFFSMVIQARSAVPAIIWRGLDGVAFFGSGRVFSGVNLGDFARLKFENQCGVP